MSSLKIRYIDEQPGVVGFRTAAVDGLVPRRTGGSSAAERLARALEDVSNEVVATGARAASTWSSSEDRGTSADHAAIPSLLLASAVHHRLVREHLRTSAALIIEAGDVREIHHVALLLGFGASAVCPYLAYESIDALIHEGELDGAQRLRGPLPSTARSLNKGVVKVMSKMGVSTVASYVGSQLFEPVGLSDDVLARYFPGFTTRLGGVTLEHLARDVLRRHAHALRDARAVSTRRSRTTASTSGAATASCTSSTPARCKSFSTRPARSASTSSRSTRRLVDDQSDEQLTLRSLLSLVPSATPMPLDEVESAASIVKRFSTGAMSYGSISKEAHTTLAVAMNRLGAKSNTGEGGEDEERYDTSDPRWNTRSAIKQVASGRFGVTSRYLVNADDLQIKMAQGAKPGEGGQLPGSKVYPWIAKTRHSTPGVGLISPPPHHDIYSIEDLAQLIYDLKCANDEARIHVKLVSEQGVGTIAAGVAKAHADVILISGHDGGTGAAPLTSLKHAGTPWELGLAEAHQTLAANGLRSRVVLQTDGQLKTGRDVIMAALLGAEEFGFATAPLVVSGCVMMRVCHLDTCPVGIATQNPVLRERFTGKPEFVENFFEFIAEEVREYLAMLGARTLDEVIGDVTRLRVTHSRTGRTTST